ncbi:MAG: alpha/beta fold hydrolase [Planctomycetales bacterium]|nr:alpha/beta fold hydrolase [Planctomycetales bacterium]
MSHSPPVSRRSVFLIGGYEPKSSEAFFKRTRRELGRFCETWDVAAEMSQQTLSDDGLLATAQVDAEIHGHRVDTKINFFVWNDIVLSDFAKPTLLRVAKYVITFADYLLTGTFFRMAGQAWRFSLYFLYPAFMLCLFSLVAWLVARGISQLAIPAAGAVGILAGLLVLVGLLRWSGRRWFVLHLMDLWSFSRAHLRGQRADAEAHIERFAQAVVAQAQQGDDDEIVLVGHSTGGALILEIAAAALALDPRLGQQGPRLTVLTVGSTALKIGLHPAAHAFRRRVQSLVDAPAIHWIECQAHTDIINFYKTDPVAAMQLNSPRAEAFPQVHVVRIRDMLQPEFYKRFKFNFFRVHYQFIMANSKRYAYDFFMMCCGEQLLAESLGNTLRYPNLPTD